MDRMRTPLLDDADRKVLGTLLVVVVGFLLVCLALGAGVGLAVRAYSFMAGG